MLHVGKELSALAEAENRDDLRRLAKRAQAAEDIASRLILQFEHIFQHISADMQAASALAEAVSDPGEIDAAIEAATEAIEFARAVADGIDNLPTTED